MKVSDLSGAALDWWALKAAGMFEDHFCAEPINFTEWIQRFRMMGVKNDIAL